MVHQHVSKTNTSGFATITQEVNDASSAAMQAPQSPREHRACRGPFEVEKSSGPQAGAVDDRHRVALGQKPLQEPQRAEKTTGSHIGFAGRPWTVCVEEGSLQVHPVFFEEGEIISVRPIGRHRTTLLTSALRIARAITISGSRHKSHDV